jgi:hypothetical protein
MLRPLVTATAVGLAMTFLVFPCLPGALARADDSPPPLGTPPPDAKALIDAPKDASNEPAVAKSLDGTTATLSAGGQLATGNSRLLAGTVNGAYATRFGNDAIGASILGNYGQGAPPGDQVVETAENLQLRFRYDRYVSDPMALFLIDTLRHDRFQGLDVRYNLDPGLKYLFLKEETNGLWGELGYDFQADVRRDPDRLVVDANGDPVIDPATGRQQILSKTATDHSVRAFVGGKHAFNKEVTFTLGAEYLQSAVDTTRYRFNFDALFAAKVSGGLAVGIGFSARFDHDPLPGKEKLDTATTLSIIYAFSEMQSAPKPVCK